MLHDYHVRSSVGHFVKMGVILYQTWSENQLTVLLKYLTISTYIRCYEACHWWQFYLSAIQCTDAYCIQHSPTATVQNTHLRLFLGSGPKMV